MVALIVLVVGLSVLCFVLGFMDQRKIYWKTAAWQYRNPEANEPSDTALGLSRVGYFVSGAILLVLAITMTGYEGSRDYSASKVSMVAHSAALRLGQDATSSGLGSSYGATSRVYRVVTEEGDGNVKVRPMGLSKYELTNRSGKNPVCLTVEVDDKLSLTDDEPWSHSVSTSVDEGPC
ncbi:hypothetical protein [Actinomadura atramentaria]|uniref:hypothetical protein n=1 Tax=Actinomadura atramentaria TaxID=1990 RepID=UPI0003705A88|nr:hypothetical protein [Actinomadura atramentaria]